MIDFDELFQTVSPTKLQEVGDAMLNGADAKTVRNMFSEVGVELSEEDIAKVSDGVLAKLAEMPVIPEIGEEISLDDLDQVAGGGCGSSQKSCGE